MVNNSLPAPEQDSSKTEDSARDCCTNCDKCSTCAMQLNVPAFMRFYVQWQKADAQLQAKLKEAYAALGQKASRCRSCGSCERACPHQVPVVARMQELYWRFEM